MWSVGRMVRMAEQSRWTALWHAFPHFNLLLVVSVLASLCVCRNRFVLSVGDCVRCCCASLMAF